MGTGDLKGCLRKLEASLRSVKYPREVDYQRLAVGDPSACLPIVSFTFTSFSPSIAEHLVDYGVELTGMNDLRFIENVYKVLRDVFSYKPLLTKQQFLQFGFAERKVTILCDIIGLILNKHKELTKESKHDSKPKRRPQLKSCIKNEIPSPESNSLVLTALTLPQKQPLVERHLGSSSAPAQIRRCSDEEETEKTELDSEALEDSTQPKDSTDCVLESRLRGVELSLLESVGRLEQRLALMEHRIHALEKSLGGKIIIESNQWENLESRVLLLETRLALTSAQGLTSQDGVFNSGKVEFKENTVKVSASGFSTVIQPPSEISDNGHLLASTPPTANQNFKERLDRIVYMMKDTANILQNIEPAM
ncbi:centrosomal protein of 44 kDa isoform X2 [Pimephales promelas]|nr:centrosomal protein of 44 kDa isoform X2 [Pimephales promelas]XP_039547185.1 centrosomal protein of 44 kDa isoform X2 [Pimephales promelas]XP_039547193.1 centrosomal protein of 44 kDa isoform X2 [Pimephales promelas]KAG1956593.1 centrosomal protein of 44 kDa [Pimephales promelas]KAG1956594.1 centrosomal protein of 44 kDa [Pimephales promelas]KAG1956595.1 centrosomal protein of 44 kDa [Pimephales promelas]KAG1956596.1 centrosomal protein of 44 kDa [Pimephales promelas]